MILAGSNLRQSEGPPGELSSKLGKRIDVVGKGHPA